MEGNEVFLDWEAVCFPWALGALRTVHGRHFTRNVPSREETGKEGEIPERRRMYSIGFFIKQAYSSVTLRHSPNSNEDHVRDLETVA